MNDSYQYTMSSTMNNTEEFRKDLEGSPGSLQEDYTIEETGSSDESLNKINYRSCSWQKTAALLFSEYICLATLTFPWSYSVLGLIPGILLSLGISMMVLYTGVVLWEFCLRHPTVRDVSDIGQILFWGQRWAWYFTATMFIVNNTFIQALHVLVGAKYLNTMTDHSVCSVVFAVISAVVCFVFSVPRTLSAMSFLATISAATMFIAIILCMIFAGIQQHPGGYDGTPVIWNLWPEKGTSFVAGMNAMLNITYVFVGQITYPSFIAEMRDPREFKKALYVVTVCEIILYVLAGSIIYVYVGNEYMTAPSFGSLAEPYKKIAFSFAVPTLIFLGVLYASVSVKFIFIRIFANSRHLDQNTVVGWSTWIGLLAITWIVAFVIAEVIPFFNDLLSLMSSLFDCWFGFVFWGMAYLQMRQQDLGPGWWKSLTPWGYTMLLWNLFLIVCGIIVLGPGTYASIDSIILAYQSGLVGDVFSCASNGI